MNRIAPGMDKLIARLEGPILNSKVQKLNRSFNGNWKYLARQHVWREQISGYYIQTISCGCLQRIETDNCNCRAKYYLFTPEHRRVGEIHWHRRGATSQDMLVVERERYLKKLGKIVLLTLRIDVELEVPSPIRNKIQNEIHEALERIENTHMKKISVKYL